MSGGHFDYDQHKIRNIHQSIQSHLDRMGKPKCKEDLWMRKEYYEEYPDELYYSFESKEVIEKMEEAIKHLKIAEIYAQRVDWYLSGDDGDDSFLERLEKDLKKLEDE